MSDKNEEVEEVRTKEDMIRDFIEDLRETELCIEPYKEHIRDLRKSYIDNDWLTKSEIWAAVRAYRFIKDDVDFDQLVDIYKKVRANS